MSGTNCTNCGAPFAALAAVRCEYCHSIKPPARLPAKTGVLAYAAGGKIDAQSAVFYDAAKPSNWQLLLHGMAACALFIAPPKRRW